MLQGRLVAILAALCVAMMMVPSPAAAAPYGSRVLKSGTRGDDVRELQQRLTRLGFATTADGVYGRGTKRNVRAWETSVERKVNGKVGKREARMIRRAADALADEQADEAESVEAVEDGEVSDEQITGGTGAGSGGASYTKVEKAKLNRDGTVTAPAGAPPAVKRVIAAANEIAHKPYRYGGGHGQWEDSGYDCSGSVSYALHGGGLLKRSMPSGGFESYGDAGAGQWITTYANGGHMYMVVAGLRFDTSAAKRQANGSRWTDEMRSSDGFVARHPRGY